MIAADRLRPCRQGCQEHHCTASLDFGMTASKKDYRARLIFAYHLQRRRTIFCQLTYCPRSSTASHRPPLTVSGQTRSHASRHSSRRKLGVALVSSMTVLATCKSEYTTPKNSMALPRPPTLAEKSSQMLERFDAVKKHVSTRGIEGYFGHFCDRPSLSGALLDVTPFVKKYLREI